MYSDEGTPNKIIDKLWLGDLFDAQSSKKLQSLGITHILTLNDWKLDAASRQNFKTLYVQIDDVPDENIACHFDKCFKFLDEASKEGGALVHCLMGMSRSATIVIAYLIARGKFSSFEDSFEYVRNCRSCVQPNPGFIRQIRDFCDRIAPEIVGANSTTDPISSAVNQRNTADNDDRRRRENIRQVYSCRACRARLFNQSAVITHRAERADGTAQANGSQTQSNEPSGSTSTSRVEDDDSVEFCTGSLFVDPYAVEWLSKLVLGGSETNGKLHCVNSDCRAKVGSYSWVGETCAACGAWVTPAFQFHKQKLDSFSFAAD